MLIQSLALKFKFRLSDFGELFALFAHTQLQVFILNYLIVSESKLGFVSRLLVFSLSFEDVLTLKVSAALKNF